MANARARARTRARAHTLNHTHTRTHTYTHTQVANMPVVNEWLPHGGSKSHHRACPFEIDRDGVRWALARARADWTHVGREAVRVLGRKLREEPEP